MAPLFSLAKLDRLPGLDRKFSLQGVSRILRNLFDA